MMPGLETIEFRHTTTARSYATRESVQGTRQRRTLAVLTGGKASANENGKGALEHKKLNNFSASSRKAPKSGSSK
jgi:hypothetical protein